MLSTGYVLLDHSVGRTWISTSSKFPLAQTWVERDGSRDGLGVGGREGGTQTSFTPAGLHYFGVEDSRRGPLLWNLLAD